MNYLLRLLCAAAAATAVTGVARATDNMPPLSHARTAGERQADGIEYRVTDRIWANTDRYWHHGDYNRVVTLLRLCTESDPDFDEACSCGAWLLWSMGDKPAANAFLNNVLVRAKNKWNAQYSFGENLMVRREYADALPYLQAAVQSSVAPVTAWKMLAHAYEHTGSLEKSRVTWRHVVERFPRDGAGPLNLRRIEAKIKNGGTAAPVSGKKSA